MLAGLAVHVAIAVPVLQIKVILDKQTHNVGEQINIATNITLDGNSTANLAAIEMISPYGNACLLRTIETGNVSRMYFRVQILDVYTCDQNGNRWSLFNPGDIAYVNVTIRNVDVVTKHVLFALYVQSGANTPLYAYYPGQVDIGAGSTIQNIFPLLLPDDSRSGLARIFASLFTDTPVNGGNAYCPEKTAEFSITTSTPSIPQQPDYNNFTFILPNRNAKLGNYTIYAVTNFNVIQTAQDIKQFKVILVGDVNKDNVVNMKDIAIAISLFQTTPSSGNWNPNADVNNDGVVNMRDIAMLVAFFGNSGIP
jgi:hypothetical protein